MGPRLRRFFWTTFCKRKTSAESSRLTSVTENLTASCPPRSLWNGALAKISRSATSGRLQATTQKARA